MKNKGKADQIKEWDDLAKCYKCKKDSTGDYLRQIVPFQKEEKTIWKALCFSCSVKRQEKNYRKVSERWKRFLIRMGLRSPLTKFMWIFKLVKNGKGIFLKDTQTTCHQCNRRFLDIYGGEKYLRKTYFFDGDYEVRKVNGFWEEQKNRNAVSINNQTKEVKVGLTFWMDGKNHHFLCQHCYWNWKWQFNYKRLFNIFTFFIAIGGISSLISFMVNIF